MYVFSSTNFPYFLYHSSNSFFKLSWVYFVMFKPMDRSFWPASVSGRSVSFRLTTCIWWNWQICTGMSSKTLGIPRLPSNMTAVMMYPRDSILYHKAAYASFVSDGIQAHPRFLLRCGALAVKRTSSPMCVASKTHTTFSAGVFWLSLTFDWSMAFLIQFLLLWYFSFKSPTVCLFQTWSWNIFLNSFCFLLLFWNCFLQTKHL